MDDVVWVFQGSGAKFASAVFRTVDEAQSWISAHALTGILTEYPLGISHLDWAISRGFFKPKPGQLENPAWLGGFTTAAARHYHYVDGAR